MATDNNIKKYTALDIERYHKRQMSAAEMNALEKAAMDDPFLADALEGYTVTGVNHQADINELKERLQNRIGESKVIPLAKSRSGNFNLLRAAVILVFVAGAGLLIYQFGFNKKNKDIALRNEPKTETTDSTPVTNNNAVIGTSDSVSSTVTSPDNQKELPVVTTSTEKLNKPAQLTSPKEKKTTEKQELASDKIVTGNTERGIDIVSEEDEVKKVQPKAVTSVPRNTDEKNVQPGIVSKTEDQKEKDLKKQKDDEFAASGYDRDNKRIAGSNRRESPQNFNTFRGRVTDRDNVGVPFANVTNLTDNNAGTYTDAKGYFNLTYPDSILSVQVRSIGFENTNVQLRNNVPTNQVVLNDDRTSLNEVVLNKQTNTAQRKAYDNMKIEEPEPQDGWEKYDAYLLNNVNVPGELAKTKSPNGTVEVSFEVNKNGEPTNLKIEKSLCNSCDKEALRLIKQGPKWKRNAKKGRTTVTIPFQ